MKNFLKLIFLIIIFIGFQNNSNTAEKVEYLKTDWSFKGLFGKFDRAALQRGYQVYTKCAILPFNEVLSYRNLAEKGGPNFQRQQKRLLHLLRLKMDQMPMVICSRPGYLINL